MPEPARRPRVLAPAPPRRAGAAARTTASGSAPQLNAPTAPRDVARRHEPQTDRQDAPSSSPALSGPPPTPCRLLERPTHASSRTSFSSRPNAALRSSSPAVVGLNRGRLLPRGSGSARALATARARLEYVRLWRGASRPTSSHDRVRPSGLLALVELPASLRSIAPSPWARATASTASASAMKARPYSTVSGWPEPRRRPVRRCAGRRHGMPHGTCRASRWRRPAC
jgi:hypothetical protein